MCGIAGIVRVSGAPPSREEIAAMVRALHHRGPDGTGIYCDTDAGLGTARLSIIDIPGGDQPIPNEDRTVWVSFNGEIFNYIELRGDLERAGHRFATHSDTEVLVHLYEEHGTRFVEHLNGQFAVAIWDTRHRRLVLARDRVGIRPLFHTSAGGRFLFASEAKALFAVRDVPRRLSPRALAETFSFWAPISSDSTFENIASLPPGHVMVVEDGRTVVTRYWDWQFPREPIVARPEGEYAEELRALLIDATRLQLRADVPVGAYLSGGLDSAIIAALVRQFSGTPLRTFSLGFEDEEFDERREQAEMVQHLGTNHTHVECTRADIAAAFPLAIWHTEVPLVRTAPAPLLLLSRAVHAHGYKVVLTGEGADEVFAGYDVFKEARVRRLMARWPGSPRVAALITRLYPYLKHSPATSAAFAQRFFGAGSARVNDPTFAHIPRWTTTSRIAQFFSPALRDAIGAWDPVAAVDATLPSAIRDWQPLARDQYVEAHTLLSTYLLASQGDRMAMANSVEGRVPFLDHRVIEFANALPPRLKLNGLTEKYILRRAVSGVLPESVRLRTKRPFRAPDSQSFFADGRAAEYVPELLSAQRLTEAGYFDPVAVSKLVEKCRSGRAIGFGDNMAFVAVLSTMLLDDMYVRNAPSPPPR